MTGDLEGGSKETAAGVDVASGNSHIAYMHLTTLISYLNSLKPNMLYK